MRITIKRILGIIGLLMAISFGVFVYGGWQMFGDELKAIKSLKMIQDRVYTFEYRGDYGFKSFLEQGGAKTDAQMHSGFSSQDEGLQALKDASYEEATLWSVIYDKEKLSSNIYFDRKWDEPLSYRIKD